MSNHSVVYGTHGYHRRLNCRSCGGTALQSFLNLGSTPLANAFRRTADEQSDETFIPLEVFFCETCSLVQLLDVVDPEVLFSDYVYVTGTSDTMAAHFAGYADTVVDMLGLTATDLVVEVGSLSLIHI